jgi:hypothetical protein
MYLKMESREEKKEPCTIEEQRFAPSTAIVNNLNARWEGALPADENCGACPWPSASSTSAHERTSCPVGIPHCGQPFAASGGGLRDSDLLPLLYRLSWLPLTVDRLRAVTAAPAQRLFRAVQHIAKVEEHTCACTFPFPSCSAG